MTNIDKEYFESKLFVRLRTICYIDYILLYLKHFSPKFYGCYINKSFDDIYHFINILTLSPIRTNYFFSMNKEKMPFNPELSSLHIYLTIVKRSNCRCKVFLTYFHILVNDIKNNCCIYKYNFVDLCHYELYKRK